MTQRSEGASGIARRIPENKPCVKTQKYCIRNCRTALSYLPFGMSMKARKFSLQIKRLEQRSGSTEGYREYYEQSMYQTMKNVTEIRMSTRIAKEHSFRASKEIFKISLETNKN